MASASPKAPVTAVTKRRHGLSNRIGVFNLLHVTLIFWIICLLLQRYLAGVTPTDNNFHSTGSPVLFLTAHPDDEAMFFAPTILSLRKADIEVFGLSLSNGNADGLGSQREIELMESYKVLRVPERNVAALDDESLLDGMEENWKAEYIASILERYTERLGIQTIITFDQDGISLHPNHKACFEVVRLLQTMRNAQQVLADEVEAIPAVHEPLTVWTLKTTKAPWKFLGLPKAIFDSVSYRVSFLHHKIKQPRQLGQTTHILGNPSDYATALRAMFKHQTQLVWFRYLYVLSSTLMQANTLALLR